MGADQVEPTHDLCFVPGMEHLLSKIETNVVSVKFPPMSPEQIERFREHMRGMKHAGIFCRLIHPEK